MTSIKISIYGFASLFLLEMGDVSEWIELGLSGITIVALFVYVVKPMTTNQIENNKKMTAAIETMTKEITQMRSDFNHHSLATNKRLDEIEEEIKKIKDKA